MSGEWTNVLKLTMNFMANRSTGSRSEGNRHCRNQAFGDNKTIETLPHIRGTCPEAQNKLTDIIVIDKKKEPGIRLRPNNSMVNKICLNPR